MNKTININLAGVIFHVDEEAYSKLTDYLRKVKESLAGEEGRDEIMADIEARIAELFQDQLNSGKQVIGMTDVDMVIEIMGTPEDYQEVTEEEPQGRSQSSEYAYRGPKKLYRNPEDKILGGVSSGLAAYLGIDAVWLRLAWILFFILSGGTAIVVYVIMWAIIPEAKTTAQKLHMRGEPINISNIERSVREEMKNVGDKVSDMASKANSSKIRRTIEDVVDALLNIAKYLGIFLARLIGLSLLILGFIAFIALIGGLMGGDVFLNGAHMDSFSLWDYGHAIFTSNTQRNTLFVGITLLLLFPIVAFVMLGLRILVGKRFPGRPIVGIFGVAAFIGLLLLIFSGITLGKDFRDNATFSKREQIEMTPDSTFSVIIDPELENYDEPEMDWVMAEKEQRIYNVDLDIRRTAGEVPYIEIKNESRGNSRKAAYERASNFNYGFRQDENRLMLSEYFSLPVDERFRGQQVDVTLYLPDGYKIYLDQTVIDLLHRVRTVEVVSDSELINQTWRMTPEGLQCMDCPIRETEWFDADETDQEEEKTGNESNYEKDWEKEAQEMEKNRDRKQAVYISTDYKGSYLSDSILTI